jgi:hypothetical protein
VPWVLMRGVLLVLRDAGWEGNQIGGSKAADLLPGLDRLSRSVKHLSECKRSAAET